MRLNYISQAALNVLTERDPQGVTLIDQLISGNLSLQQAKEIEQALEEGQTGASRYDFVKLTSTYLSPYAFHKMVSAFVRLQLTHSNYESLSEFFLDDSFACKLYRYQVYRLGIISAVDNIYAQPHNVQTQRKMAETLLPIWRLFENTKMPMQTFLRCVYEYYGNALVTEFMPALREIDKTQKLNLSTQTIGYLYPEKAKQDFYQACQLSRFNQFTNFVGRNLTLNFLILAIAGIVLTCLALAALATGILPIAAICTLAAVGTVSALTGAIALNLNLEKEFTPEPQLQAIPFGAKAMTSSFYQMNASLARVDLPEHPAERIYAY